MRGVCLALPHAAASIEWDNKLVVTIDEKKFAIAALNPEPVWLSLRSTPEGFAEPTERPGGAQRLICRAYFPKRFASV
ncbi:MAG: MmcQ/YjbR family DNA-binding protein [Bryobacterales bacterium]